MTVYDDQFNLNEWFIFIVLILSIILMVKLKPRMDLPILLTLYLFGVTSGMFFDHTISIEPFNFYDVNDNSSYQLMDFISYVMYGPFAYFFIFFYEKFNVRAMKTIVYIVIWTSGSILLEWISHKIGIFHYRKGYQLFFSIPVYLSNQTILVIFYHLVIKEYRQKVKIKKGRVNA